MNILCNICISFKFLNKELSKTIKYINVVRLIITKININIHRYTYMFRNNFFVITKYLDTFSQIILLRIYSLDN